MSQTSSPSLLAAAPDQSTNSGGVMLRGLRKSYGTATALHSIDLDIKSGEFVSLLGPSGCGKTTLLRCIAGLIEPSSGDIIVGGRSVHTLPIHKRNFGMVFQSYALFPHMSVAQNVAFGLKMAGCNKQEAAERSREALELVSMAQFAERLPHQLSGGQQQRVALARAIVTRPSLLLLDEPFGALDAKLRAGLQVELRALQQKLGITTIFVTHDQDEAMLMSDRIAVMSGGYIHQFADPEAVYNSPATTFVADFVGQVNEISEPRAIATIPTGGRAIIRPERLRIGTPPQSAIVFTGRLQDLRFSGDTILANVETEAGLLVCARKNTGEPLAAPIGSQVQLWCRADDIVAFDSHGKAV